ncbi:MAG: hypothetical protein Unbinned3138contig1002_30 [Prokaryotic dsDNA virus sp.]|nr:MAG: hypothetical protein Unbinned3138contig1002_30 [Prokaryotic dsDNA virus sp.]|tara:strand:- start:4052 stop:4360 length:309 start_codon:yes stop_codon:yes gene_type:complete
MSESEQPEHLKEPPKPYSARYRGYYLIEKKLGREKAFGEALYPEKTIFIDPRQNSKEMMDTIIHELFHVMPLSRGWSEEDVCKSAEIVTYFLWKQGYRRIQK